jgi:gamma-D-glutamyl-L-lysine dipeptidyl-peptidase
MNCAICTLSLVPVRAEPSDRSEMVTQLIFGDLITIHEEQGTWLQVTTDYDGYQGWIDYKQCRPVSDAFVEKFRSSPSPVCYDLVQLVVNETRNLTLPVTLGSTLPNMVNNTFYIDDDKFTFRGMALQPKDITRHFICDIALMYLHSPYLWGGRSPFGIDCSGLVQMVYRICGYRMPRDAAQQVKQGSMVSFISEAAPGDIVFFDDEEGQIIHAGLLLDNNKVIHASGRVKVDTIDHEGIYNQGLKRYTHKLRIIKSVF